MDYVEKINIQKECYESLPDCPICLAKIGKRTGLTTDCGHLYHFKCLWVWLKSNNSCPLCRSEIFDKTPVFFFSRIQSWMDTILCSLITIYFIIMYFLLRKVG